MQIDKHNIGLRRFDRQAFNPLQALGQTRCQRVVIGQPLDMVLQRMQGRSGQHAGLAHAAAQHFTNAVRPANKFPTTAQSRTNRRAQPLTKTHRHAVKTLRDAACFLLRRLSRLRRLRHSCIEQARAV